MYKNSLNSITYVHTGNDRWVAFNRVYNVRYYDLSTYEREDRIKSLFNKYFQDSNRLDFSFHSNKTIISMDV
ncbi:MAG: hypothetical protein ACW99Q_22610 [Candidatus Kariarchaeaceae archaeon]|jgi:hypothetical protein